MPTTCTETATPEGGTANMHGTTDMIGNGVVVVALWLVFGVATLVIFACVITGGRRTGR
jgi:hypothetical protein